MMETDFFTIYILINVHKTRSLHMCPTFPTKMDLVTITQDLLESLNRKENLRYILPIYIIEREWDGT